MGHFSLPCSNISLTLLAPTPTNISTKSDPEIEKNGTLASPAIALANKVLPVPGAPINKSSLWNFSTKLSKIFEDLLRTLLPLLILVLLHQYPRHLAKVIFPVFFI